MEDSSFLPGRIRNTVLLVVLSVMILWAAGMSYIGYQIAREGIIRYTEDNSESIAAALFDPFLASNYSALDTAIDQIVSERSELGIQYIAVYDDRGRYVISSTSTELSGDAVSYLNSERFQDDDTFFIAESHHVRGSGGLNVIEVNKPISAGGSNYGALKIGFDYNYLWSQWSTVRNQYVVASGLALAFIVIIILFLGSRWETLLENEINRIRSETANQYESKMEEMEQEIDVGPLSSDEFFQIIDFAKRINKILDPMEMVQFVVESTADILEVRQVVLFMVSQTDSNILRGQAGIKDGEWMEREHLQGIEIEIGSGEIGTIAELGQTNIIDKPRPGASVAAALHARDQVLGVLRATERRVGGQMGQKEKLKIRLIAQISGNAIYNAYQSSQRNEPVDTG